MVQSTFSPLVVRLSSSARWLKERNEKPPKLKVKSKADLDSGRGMKSLLNTPLYVYQKKERLSPNVTLSMHPLYVAAKG